MAFSMEITDDENVFILDLKYANSYSQIYQRISRVYAIKEINNALPSSTKNSIDESRLKTVFTQQCD